MPRFHISPGSEKDGVVMLDKEESHHALAVLRLKAGEVVELLDGQGGVFQGIVVGAERGHLKISVRDASEPAVPSRVLITSAASIVKSESMEFLIQKSCELGANFIIPLISERTVVRLSRERWETKIQRWQKIAKESCKQCGQSSIPVIRPVAELKIFLETISQYDLSLIPTLAVSAEDLYRTLNANQSVKSILLLIGPEGDFSRDEVNHAVTWGAKPVNLGPRVLRSETAALYSLSVVNFFYQKGSSANG